MWQAGDDTDMDLRLEMAISFFSFFFSPYASILGAWREALMIVNTLEITAWLFKGHIINPATAQHCDPQHFHIHFKHSDVNQYHN